ncbi:NADH-quinone oxidoreductase subunit NuoN [Pikeienuella piscinae]|uniref:NADH-quinone oxidoreductase subunit N n=1 Tax=Pikeienuella piscinae TaxID=2748098 RepID=A0A7L5BXC6_9RHOB|nr:NADH-quinone oxidoreductase subunit NuoN [Pikeienuella piscinae]QIE54249.1 NADH-quinone oxidoreductase subunit NuoN [Pikeienuella piscinae]
MTGADFDLVLPEIILALGSMGLLMFGTFGGGDERAGTVNWLMAGLMTLLAAIIAVDPGSGVAFGGAYVADAFSNFAKVLILLSAAVVLVLSRDFLVRRGLMKFEFPVLIGLAVTGMMMMVSSGDLMSLYMGLELQSLALYVVAAFRRDSLKSTEAGLKYFVLGALSSGLLLYGASLVYGYTGSTNFTRIAAVVAAEEVSLGLIFGISFLAAGMAFKMSAAPFHMWTPDVYEGSPTPVTTFFATSPKIAAGVLFARVMYDAFGDATEAWRQIIVFISLVSMFWGAFAGIGQTDIKRLMAYSSIGHMGFALIGLAAGTVDGAEALLIYLAIYLIMTLGVFAFILSMERGGRPVTRIDDFCGLSKNSPGQAMALAALLFSLAGIPPLAGFFGKYFVFVAAVDAGLAPLALAGVVASVIGAFYYLRIIKLMYFDEVDQPLDGRLLASHRLTLGFCALAMTIGWLPFMDGFGLIEASRAAAEALVR